MEDIGQVEGQLLKQADRFSFCCQPGLSCFNQCCRNLNLFLYPFDVIQLKHELGLSSDLFLDAYVDVVMRADNFFPDVLLKMTNKGMRPCVFSTASGCRVYQKRPYTCRTFPVEYGMQYDASGGKSELVGFFRPPGFCQGPQAQETWTLTSWSADQGADIYQRMAEDWSAVKGLFKNDPWGREGPQGNRAKMAFMASYNMDAFRAFVFGSSLLKRFKVKTALLKKIEKDDVALMRFGFDWIKLTVWGIKTRKIRRR